MSKYLFGDQEHTWPSIRLRSLVSGWAAHSATFFGIQVA